jgi:hypothetical protein
MVGLNARLLAGAMLAIPSKLKSETVRFRKSKFGDGGEMHTLKDGNKIIWRQWTPAKELKRLAKQSGKRRRPEAR